MKYIKYLITSILIVFTFLVCTCGQANSKEEIKTQVNVKKEEAFEIKDTVDRIKPFLMIDSTLTYTEIKANIKKEKSKINLKTIDEDSLSLLFTNFLVYEIIPYWYGTKWSFEGHTSIPQKGEIACGYFVSTTLKDMGLNVNRYKLAQQLPINEAKTINLGKELLEINEGSSEENIALLKTNLKEGIYFLGFDQSHVGYILKKDENLYVIHSNYIGAEGVVIEKIEESEAFLSYYHFYIADISHNKELMRKWVLNEEIQVVLK